MDEHELRRERVGWLRCLITSFLDLRTAVDAMDEETDGLPADNDPDATFEMLGECRRLADELERELPPPPAEPPPVAKAILDEIPW